MDKESWGKSNRVCSFCFAHVFHRIFECSHSTTLQTVISLSIKFIFIHNTQGHIVFHSNFDAKILEYSPSNDYIAITILWFQMNSWEKAHRYTILMCTQLYHIITWWKQKRKIELMCVLVSLRTEWSIISFFFTDLFIGMGLQEWMVCTMWSNNFCELWANSLENWIQLPYMCGLHGLWKASHTFSVKKRE